VTGQKAGFAAAAEEGGPHIATSPSETLLRAARRRDPEAFVRLIAPERARLESLAYRLLSDSAAIADVMQEVYLSDYRALPRYRGDSKLSTWLYRITYNACLKHEARSPRKLTEELQHGEPLPDPSPNVVERLDLASALAALPIEQRALVLMVDRDGFSYRTAALALGIPVGTVSSRLSAARATLRRKLAPEEESGGG
jgi:RNA polymerase sigma-70 factor, ECF subfamily